MATDATGDTCGCSAPVAPDAPPIACSLGPEDVDARVQQWQAVLAPVRQRTAIDGGVRLAFGPDAPLAELAQLAAAEHECCSFFAFALTIDHRGVALEVTAPDEGRPLVTSLFGEPG